MPSSFSARSIARRFAGRPATAPLGVLRHAAAPIALGLLVGTAVQLALPMPVYRAAAVVAPEPGGARNATDLRQLALFALSRSVLRSAAAELVARNELAARPGPLERLGLIRLDGERDRVDRLADQLADAAHAAPSGDALLLGMEADDPVRAARMAQAFADSFLSKRAEATATAQRTRESELATRIAAAEAAAGAARKRFLAAGGADAGVEKARAAAAADVREAEARIARLRGILASGTPPIADDATATQAIADLQANYLDLQGKLAQALQTLGERHTTVITLRDSIRRTGSELSAAWTRQLRSAEADRDAVKLRETTLFRNDPGKDAVKQAALEDARRAKEAADTALLRAEAELDFLPDQPGFVLRSAATTPPEAAAGWFPIGRAVAAVCSGIASILILVAGRLALDRVRRRRSSASRITRRTTRGPRREPAATMTIPVAANDQTAHGEAASPDALSFVAEATRPSVWDAPLRTESTSLAMPTASTETPGEITAAMPAAAASLADDPASAASEAPPRFFRAAAAVPSRPIVAMDDQPVTPTLPTDAIVAELAAILARQKPDPAASEAATLHELRTAFAERLAELRVLSPAHGPIPTLMVAATPAADRIAAVPGDDAGTATTDVALALGEVAAASGLRVLLVEASRERGVLAEHAASERRPCLVGMRDGLRLVFAADAVAGLFLAPLFSRRAQLVSALSRHRDATLVEDVAARYDLLLIDGGDAAAAARAGWSADHYLAVAPEADLAASARFLAALRYPAGIFAGTVVDATFVPPPRVEAPRGARPADLAAA